MTAHRPMSGRRDRRGLTLLELILALSITAIIAAAIAGMMQTVTTGVMTRRGNREAMIRANAAQSRLAAYVTSSRSLLHVGDDDVVLWLGDYRRSDSVHASEIRWVRFDADRSTIVVDFVDFPSEWSDVAIALEDGEYASNAAWDSIRDQYAARGWVSTFTLVDEVASLQVETDTTYPLTARHVSFSIEFTTEESVLPIISAATIREHRPPA